MNDFNNYDSVSKVDCTICADKIIKKLYNIPKNETSFKSDMKSKKLEIEKILLDHFGLYYGNAKKSH